LVFDFFIISFTSLKLRTFESGTDAEQDPDTPYSIGILPEIQSISLQMGALPPFILFIQFKL